MLTECIVVGMSGGAACRDKRHGLAWHLFGERQNSLRPPRHSRECGNPWGWVRTAATNPMDSGFRYAAPE